MWCCDVAIGRTDLSALAVHLGVWETDLAPQVLNLISHFTLTNQTGPNSVCVHDMCNLYTSLPRETTQIDFMSVVSIGKGEGIRMPVYHFDLFHVSYIKTIKPLAATKG